MATGHARHLRGYLRQAFDRQMAQDTVEAESQVDRCIRLWQRPHKVCNLECESYTRQLSEITCHVPRHMNLGLGDVKASRGDAGESKPAGVCDETTQPRTGTAARVENADRGCSRGTQVAKFRVQNRTDLAIRIRMVPCEGEQVIGVTIGIA